MQCSIKLGMAALAGLAASLSVGQTMKTPQTFAEDVAFLKKHTNTIVLRQPSGAAIAVVPAWQGRVMTSTVSAGSGVGNGWINYAHIASKKLVPHINVFGGEDRFWLGPEGGQFALYFKPGSSFDLANWQTPALIDTEPFDIVQQGATSVKFAKRASLTNYSNTTFDLAIERTVRLVAPDVVRKLAGLGGGSRVQVVAYETVNTIANAGKEEWNTFTGMPSIWILAMLKPSDTTTIIVPVRNAKPTDKVVVDNYFGKVPPSRLKRVGNIVYFSGDGKFRSKIGVPPQFASPFLGSYDPVRRLLTVVQFTLPEGRTDYVNSLWEIQDKPFGGDAANSYNDGPPAPGKKPLGPFYEIESSSPAANLKPGQSTTHVHRTMHFIGAEAELQKIATRLLGVDLKQAKAIFR